MAWGWAHFQQIFIFAWSIPLRYIHFYLSTVTDTVSSVLNLSVSISAAVMPRLISEQPIGVSVCRVESQWRVTVGQAGWIAVGDSNGTEYCFTYTYNNSGNACGCVFLCCRSPVWGRRDHENYRSSRDSYESRSRERET